MDYVQMVPRRENFTKELIFDSGNGLNGNYYVPFNKNLYPNQKLIYGTLHNNNM